MNKKKDWMERSHEGVYDQGTQTTTYLTSSVFSRIGFSGPILAWYNNEFLPRWGSFKTAFENWRNPAERTTAKTAALKSAETEFRKVYRILYTGYLQNNPLVTDEDLVKAGMHERPSGKREPPRVPDTLIRVVTKIVGPGKLAFNYGDENIGGTAKPEDVHGAEMIYVVTDSPTPPADWSQLTHSLFDTHTPLELALSGDLRGKWLHFSMRWENTQGAKGPWNAIQSVLIP
jgi:hypothetical protein